LEGDCFQNGDKRRAISSVGDPTGARVAGNAIDYSGSAIGAPKGDRVAGNAIGGCKPLPCKVEWYLNAQANPIMFIMWPPNVLSCVPAGSVEANGVTYIWMMNVVHWGGFGQTHAWSMLLKGTPTPANYAALPLHFEIDSKFVNAAFVNTGNVIYIFGTGLYRASPIFLAQVNASEIENRNAWQFFSANVAGHIVWTYNEDLALPVIAEAVAGELSVIWSTYLKQFVVTAFEAVGLVMYRCNTPFGPWTKQVIFNEVLPYKWKTPDMTGSYGGYMVPDQGVNTPILFMTFSFWTPYRTYMMTCDLSQLGTGESIIKEVVDIKTGTVYNDANPIPAQPGNEKFKYNFHDMSWKASLLGNVSYYDKYDKEYTYPRF
jgi:hypothetical protein